jgi:hypothetical protein
MQQPPLPHMEPIKPMAQPQTQPAKPPSNIPVQTKGRLRQIVAYVGGASLGFVLLVAGGELVLKPGLRPSDIVATVESNVELGLMNQRLGHKPGEHVLTEDEYRKTIAQAEREGQAKAEIEFQRELAQVQADREIVVQAYLSLYQRANAIAQAAIQLESLAQQFRQQLLTMSNGGRSMVIGVKDLFCGLGSPEACQSAREDRRSMISESDELSRGDVGARVRELMAGVPDPATFVMRGDTRRSGARPQPAR